MDGKIPIKSEIIDNVRNLAISRPGGIRTRGGRLPPINIREITQMTGSKKVIAPNIPQRRRTKTEPAGTSTRQIVKAEKSSYSENSRGRGKNRQQKVYLQTEGSFLAQGPAARLKRDPISDGSYSVPRVSRNATKASSYKNIDADVVKDLMESYVVGEEYENDYEGKPPFRLPLQKVKTTCKIKAEFDEDDKTKIKKEIKKEMIEDFETGIKKEIKTEKDEDLVSAKESITCKEEIEDEKPFSDNFLNDEGPLILLQLPLLSKPLKIEADETDKGVKERGKQPPNEKEPKLATKFIDTLEEGFIGKLKLMKSGRMKLTLGSVEFELSDGTPSQTYQEVVSIQTGHKQCDVTVLGKVEKKLTLSPVINSLLAENAK